MKTQSLTTKDNMAISINEFLISDAKANIVLAGATGVPMRYYRHFATAANAEGFNVYCIDYRGIGESAPATLKGFEVDYLDWAKQDLAALIDHVSSEQSACDARLPIFLVGHSYGGHALGLLPNIDKVQAAYFFATGAGYSGYMPFAEKCKVELLWRVIAPVVVRATGYMAWSKLGMGDDLPKGVYTQWKRWCQYPRYFFDDPEMDGVDALFARFTGKIVAANAIDDKWAMPASRNAFVANYTNANVQAVDLVPKEYGLSEIGHIAYFSQKSKALWPAVFDFFDVELKSNQVSSSF
jgi:predicted alpha/beta hydrolase